MTGKDLAQELEERFSKCYGELTDQLRRAADFVIHNPFEVATRSMRSVASMSDLSPATYTRLARAAGFKDYDALKAICVSIVNQNQEYSFFDRATHLQESEVGDEGHLLYKQASASIRNIDELVQSVEPHKLEDVACLLMNAPRVAVAGALSSQGFALYMSYVGSWCRPNWFLFSPNNTTGGLTSRDLNADDVILMITKSPNSRYSITSLEYGRNVGASIVLITDNHKCPAIEYADHLILVPTDSPQFFSSYVATTVVLETLLSMMVMKGGDATRTRIASIEETNRQIGEYWSETQ